MQNTILKGISNFSEVSFTIRFNWYIALRIFNLRYSISRNIKLIFKNPIVEFIIREKNNIILEFIYVTVKKSVTVSFMYKSKLIRFFLIPHKFYGLKLLFHWYI